MKERTTDFAKKGHLIADVKGDCRRASMPGGDFSKRSMFGAVFYNTSDVRRPLRIRGGFFKAEKRRLMTNERQNKGGIKREGEGIFDGGAEAARWSDGK